MDDGLHDLLRRGSLQRPCVDRHLSLNAGGVGSVRSDQGRMHLILLDGTCELPPLVQKLNQPFATEVQSEANNAEHRLPALTARRQRLPLGAPVRPAADRRARPDSAAPSHGARAPSSYNAASQVHLHGLYAGAFQWCGLRARALLSFRNSIYNLISPLPRRGGPHSPACDPGPRRRAVSLLKHGSCAFKMCLRTLEGLLSAPSVMPVESGAPKG